MSWKLNKKITWPIIQMQVMPKTILNSWELLDEVWSLTKTRLDNDMTNRTSAVYVKDEIDLSLPIQQGVVYDENQTGIRCDWLNNYGLCRKLYRIVKTSWTRCGIWRKTRQNNYMINSIGVVYVENNIEELGHIISGAIFDENKIGEQCD